MIARCYSVIAITAVLTQGTIYAYIRMTDTDSAITTRTGHDPDILVRSTVVCIGANTTDALRLFPFAQSKPDKILSDSVDCICRTLFQNLSEFLKWFLASLFPIVRRCQPLASDRSYTQPQPPTGVPSSQPGNIPAGSNWLYGGSSLTKRHNLARRR